MYFDHKVRTFITRSDGVQKWCVGNRKNLGSGPLPNNARPGCWRVQILTPFWYFYPDGLKFVWPSGKIFAAGSCRGEVWVHPWPLLPCRLISHHGPVAFGGLDDHEPARLVLDARRQSTGCAGTMQVGNTRGLFSMVQSNNGHTILIWTTMGLIQKWVAHSPDHVHILFLFNTCGLPRALLNLLNFLLDAFHPTIHFLLPR